ncbi:hypothetical protein ACFDR9_001610 [Janthinobacterium sp. CG_23.3]|uniref:hypothetical protein n=1 Tax=Janthinobacterium sp. CG_23.3 TaxID=3349634 RepID=UPI0038D3A576
MIRRLRLWLATRKIAASDAALMRLRQLRADLIDLEQSEQRQQVALAARRRDIERGHA